MDYAAEQPEEHHVFAMTMELMIVADLLGPVYPGQVLQLGLCTPCSDETFILYTETYDWYHAFVLSMKFKSQGWTKIQANNFCSVTKEKPSSKSPLGNACTRSLIFQGFEPSGYRNSQISSPNPMIWCYPLYTTSVRSPYHIRS